MQKQINKLPITNDYVFKRVFSYEGNESVLKDFLEAILNIEIKKIIVKNPEIIKTSREDKKSVLDIKIQVNDNTLIDVEMQMGDEKNLRERSTTYAGKMIAGQLQEGDQYTDLKKTIVIFIMNFNGIKRNSYHHIARMRYDKTTKESYVDMGYEQEEEVATNYLETHYIEIPKFKKKNPDTKARINQWLWLLAGEEEKVKMAEKENEEVKKAAETLNRISLDPVERERYESMIQAEFNRAISERNFFKAGKEEGKKEGEKKKQKEIARKMLEKGMTIKEIEEITGVTKEEIEKIKKK